jgi:Phage holin family Hol44, in holin superfamily V
MPDLDLIENVTQLSPPALLAVGLWFLGSGLKKSPMPDWLIPFVLPCVGAALFPFIADTTSVSYSVKSPTAFNAIVGFCIGGAAVAMNEAVKQFTNRKTEP